MYSDIDYDLLYFQSEINSVREDLQNCLFEMNRVEIQVKIVKRLSAIERTSLAYDLLDIARVSQQIRKEVISLLQNRCEFTLERELFLTKKLHELLYKLIITDGTPSTGNWLPWIINTSRMIDNDLDLFFETINMTVYKTACMTGKKVQLCIDNNLYCIPGLSLVQPVLMHVVTEIVQNVLECEVARFDVHENGTSLLIFRLFSSDGWYHFDLVSDGFGLCGQTTDTSSIHEENEIISSEIYHTIHKLGGIAQIYAEKLIGARITIVIPREVDRLAVLQVS